MRLHRADWISIPLIVLGFVIAALLYDALPDPVPTHWDMAGEADGFTPKPWGVFIMPLITLATYLVLRVLPAISPKGFRMDGFIRVYHILLATIVAFLFGIGIVQLLAAAGAAIDIVRIVPLALGLLFVILGNYMGKLEQNFFIGIRTPWTLASDEVWARTHRFGGKLFVVAGLAMIAASVLGLPIGVAIAAVVVAALVSVAHSFFVYWRIERDG